MDWNRSTASDAVICQGEKRGQEAQRGMSMKQRKSYKQLITKKVNIKWAE